jgi:hypothetical protein
MGKKYLNITNGECFNEYFVSKFGNFALPFNEVLMDGDTTADIYSKEFISLRARELNTNVDEYRSKMQVFDVLKQNAYSELHLWFGKDTFCQINLLTLLAYLEQSGFSGNIFLNYIDDETFEVIEPDINVELGQYRHIYQQVLLLKQTPKDVGVLIYKAIMLYFDYHSSEGYLANLVKENSDMDRMSLICLLLEKSKDYGLSDLQAQKLINCYSPN